MKKRNRDSREIVINNRLSFSKYFIAALHSRQLVAQFTQKLIKARYKQRLLGVAWIFVQPIITLLIFTVVFGLLLNQIESSSSEVPYVLFVQSGLMVWQLFSSVITVVTHSLIQNRDLIKKIYFPRIILPLSNTAATLLDFSINLVLFLILILVFRVPLSWRMLLTIPLLAHTCLLAFGPGLMIAALSLRYRDLIQILPVLLRLGFYAMPIGWAAQNTPELVQRFYVLNPIVGIMDGIRWTLFGSEFPSQPIALSFIISGAMIVVGFFVFVKKEATFADHI